MPVQGQTNVRNSTPDPLVIDFDLLRTAPPELNVAGIGDLLSIHTATFDWEYVMQKPNLWYSIIDDSLITREWALKAIGGLRF